MCAICRLKSKSPLCPLTTITITGASRAEDLELKMNALFGTPIPACRGRNTYVLEYVDQPRFWVLSAIIILFYAAALSSMGSHGQQRVMRGNDPATPPRSTPPPYPARREDGQRPSGAPGHKDGNGAPGATDDHDNKGKDATPVATRRPADLDNTTNNTARPRCPDSYAISTGPRRPFLTAPGPAAAVFYLVVLYLVLLEGYWLAATMWRWTGAVAMPPPLPAGAGRLVAAVALVARVLATGFMLCVDGVLLGVGAVLVVLPVGWLLELGWGGGIERITRYADGIFEGWTDIKTEGAMENG